MRSHWTTRHKRRSLWLTSVAALAVLSPWFVRQGWLPFERADLADGLHLWLAPATWLLLVVVWWTRPDHPAPAPNAYLGWPWRRTTYLRGVPLVLLVLALPSFIWLVGLSAEAQGYG